MQLARRPLFGIAIIAAAQGCAWGTVAARPDGADPTRIPLAERIDLALSEAPFDRVSWGVVVVDAATSRSVYERNPDLLFIPGSNAKIPATVAALGLLGPDFRWETTLYSSTLPAGGVVPGDLFLAGRGDPTLGRPYHPSASSALASLADSLVAAGARRITGRLFVDVSAWDSTTVPDSWMVEDLPATAGATGGAFAVERGEIEILVRGSPNPLDRAAVSWEPHGPDDSPSFVEGRVTTGEVGSAGDLSARFLPESRRWVVEGIIPPDETRTLELPARDPVGLAVASLERALDERGVSLPGGASVIWDPGRPIGRSCASGEIPACAEMLRVAGIASPPLSEVAEEILGPSQNWTAEQLVRTLGSERGGEGSWAEGFRVIQAYLQAEAGLVPEDSHLEDGSGLSNHNLISPRALSAILLHARSESWGPLFRSALAEPGEEGSTLASRLPALEGRVFAKTGTLSHVNSLSGYVVADDGREFVFSVLSNGANLPASQMRERIDQLVTEMARGR